MKKLKILSIVGTRPEIIRLSEIIKKLDKFTNNVLVNTGQNFNYNLSKVFFKDLDLRKPNYEIKNRSKNLHQQISYIINGVGTIIEKEKPDAFIVLGDTNSSLSLIVAKRMGILHFILKQEIDVLIIITLKKLIEKLLIIYLITILHIQKTVEEI